MGSITLDGLTKRFDGETAVDDVDLGVEDGELLVLVGPSGCGKTTLLRTIAGLEEPTAGSVAIDGIDVTTVPARKRDVGFVFQDYALFPHMDVRENLSFNLRMQGGYDDVDDRTDETAALLDIEALLERDVSDLSGGQKQRVALGRAIAAEPAAFLLDEPLANLDATLRERMQTEIARLQRRLGITTVHVTHNQREAMTMGDRIAVMADGEIQQVGTPEAVYGAPETLFVAEFVGSPRMNTLAGRYDPDAGCVVVENPSLSIPVGDVGAAGQVVVGSRPEDTAVVEGERTGADWLTGTVDFVDFHGADRYVHLAVTGETTVIGRVRASSAISEDDVASVRFDPDALHVFDAETGRRRSLDRERAGTTAGPSEVEGS